MSTDWSESDFSSHLLDVFDYYGIEYQTEVPLRNLGDSTGSRRKMDIYVLKTDTAIELKGAKGDLERGLGQAMNYTRVCKESILMLDGEAADQYRQDIHRTCQIAPAVHFSMVIPNGNPNGSGAGLDVRTDSRPDLFHEMLYNEEWDDDIAVVKQLIPEYVDHQEERWARPVGDQTLSGYQQNGVLKRAILAYVESSNAPVSLNEVVEHIHEDVDGVNRHDSAIYDAFRSLCDEKRIIKLSENNYVERFDPDS
ncbi:hypothetical protein ACOZ35_01835 [Halorubrum xinjiangense]|uniref:hypothetical protein n=1 Tax=Halorubrum xinjiangense TaxID=261291 RepID=UPI003C704714